MRYVRGRGNVQPEWDATTKVGNALDLLIAAHALALGAVVVTNNEREFRRVPALVVENWVA